MAEQGREVPRETRDSDGEEYSKAEEVNTLELYVPDMDNTPLETAIRNGMALNDSKTIYRICCPKLKRYIGMDTLTAPRRMTGSAYGPTSQLHGKLRSHSIRPAKTPSRSYAKLRHHPTRAGHTAR